MAAAALVLPSGPYMPEAHLFPLHDVLPGEVEYVPDGHCVQVAAVADVDPVGPKNPAAHGVPEHDAPEALVRPAAPNVPGAQGDPVQEVCPGNDEYVPAGQVEHEQTPPAAESVAGPNDPAGHGGQSSG